jgi:hypothetical protein
MKLPATAYMLRGWEEDPVNWYSIISGQKKIRRAIWPNNLNRLGFPVQSAD